MIGKNLMGRHHFRPLKPLEEGEFLVAHFASINLTTKFIRDINEQE